MKLTFHVPSWTSSFLGLVTFIIFLPGIFNEFDVQDEVRAAAFRAHKDGDGGESNEMELPKPDYLVLVICVASYSFYLFNFVVIET